MKIIVAMFHSLLYSLNNFIVGINFHLSFPNDIIFLFKHCLYAFSFIKIICPYLNRIVFIINKVYFKNFRYSRKIYLWMYILYKGFFYIEHNIKMLFHFPFFFVFHLGKLHKWLKSLKIYKKQKIFVANIKIFTATILLFDL